MNSSRWLRRRIALPSEHGSYALFLSPLSIGYVAGGRWDVACAYLFVAASCGFLVRQPIVALAKVRSGRRPATDLPAIRLWLLVYGFVGALHVYGLVLRGFAYLLWLVVPAVPVVGWHLWLIMNRAERRRMLVEIVGTGLLSSSAVAALWVGVGRYDHTGWLLWLLLWAEGAAAIVYTYLRLAQRTAGPLPARSDRLGLARAALGVACGNVLLVGGFVLGGILSPGLLLPYGIQAAETLHGSLRPATGLRPREIGIRQLVVTALFTIAFMLAWGR